MFVYLCIYVTLSVFCRQEGWRLENEHPTDPSSTLMFKGVVFNEMKGAFVSQPTCYYHVNYFATFFYIVFNITPEILAKIMVQTIQIIIKIFVLTKANSYYIFFFFK